MARRADDRPGLAAPRNEEDIRAWRVTGEDRAVRAETRPQGVTSGAKHPEGASSAPSETHYQRKGFFEGGTP